MINSRRGHGDAEPDRGEKGDVGDVVPECPVPVVQGTGRPAGLVGEPAGQAEHGRGREQEDQLPLHEDQEEVDLAAVLHRLGG